MAEMLHMHIATFYRKIKDLNKIDPDISDNKECEFCKRMKADDIPSPSVAAITNEMMEYLKNACNGHKYAEMARSLKVKPGT